MNTPTLTLVAPAAEPACPAWCLRHDPGVTELCLGPAIDLDFGPADPGNPDLARHVRLITYNEPGNVVTLSLVVSSGAGVSSCDLTPVRARQIAAALNQAAALTEGGA